MGKPLRVLMVEDSEDDILLTIHALKKGGYEPVYERVETAEAMRKALKKKTWDVILCDYKMPKFNGIAAIVLLKKTGMDIPLIIVSGTIGEELAAECMRLGAHDYIIKSNLSRLVPAIERELKEAETRIQHKRAEEALKKSENKYRLLAEHMTDIVWIMDLDLSVTWLSPSATKARGFSLDEIVVLPLDRQLPPESLGKAVNWLGKLMRLEKERRNPEPDGILSRDLEFYCKGGHTIWLDCTFQFLRDDQGKATSILAEGKDITERKLVVETLKESENRYRLLADNVNDVIFALDMNLNYTFVSPSIKILRGYEPEEVLKQPSSETLTPSSMDLAMRTLSEIMELEKSRRSDINISTSRTLQLEMRRKDGTTVWTEVKFSIIRDKDQQMVGILGVTRDITDRIQVEDELKQSEERYRNIFDNAQEGIFRSISEGRFIMANQSMANMIGYETPEELMTSVTDITRQIYVDPEERAKIKQIIKEQGSVKNYETQLRKKDGSIFWVSLTMQAVRDEKGQLLYYEGMDEDITNRKESAERTKKALGATVQAIAVTVETRDPYTAGHQRRVADLARAFATEMNLPADQIDGIRMAAAIHDLGKISVPAEILSKPTILTAIEFDLIKTHSQSGYDILKDIDFPWPVARAVLEHHERMNGSGYPNGLTGDNLLMESRILAVADVVESMASHRPYRPSLGIEAALEEIEKNKGTLYDNAVADACMRLFRERGYQLERI